MSFNDQMFNKWQLVSLQIFIRKKFAILGRSLEREKFCLNSYFWLKYFKSADEERKVSRKIRENVSVAIYFYDFGDPLHLKGNIMFTKCYQNVERLWL